jgi:hypothetical protein
MFEAQERLQKSRVGEHPWSAPLESGVTFCGNRVSFNLEHPYRSEPNILEQFLIRLTPDSFDWVTDK